jgi:putative flippase GtrA
MTDDLPAAGDRDRRGRTGLRSVLDLFVSWQFLKFLLVGATAAGVHWLARYLLTEPVGYEWALVLAYGVGITVGYCLNAVFVFSEAVTTRRQQVTYFVAFNLMMAPVVIGIAYALSEYLFPAIGWTYNPRGVAHGIGVASPIFINFLLHKFFTFKGG